MAASSSANPGFVYDGYHRFWQVADLLMRDREPAVDEWQGLLSAPGYQELIAHEFSPEFFPEHFRLAFKPSLGASLAQVLRGGSHARLLRHYLLAAETREHIARGMAAMASAPVAATARQAALAWLPRDFTPAFPTVAFVIFAPDARGYASVVVDASFACQHPAPQALLAHEYHHVFRRQLVAARAAQAPGDEDVLWVFDQLEAEGIADQLDKRSWPEDAPVSSGLIADYARRYRQHFLAAPELIRRLDALLGAWHETPPQREEIAKRLRAAIPLAGHPMGSFMARQIERRFGRRACISAVGNPFAFMRLYNEAAAGDGRAPALSVAALRAVASLEGTYLPSS